VDVPPSIGDGVDLSGGVSLLCVELLRLLFVEDVLVLLVEVVKHLQNWDILMPSNRLLIALSLYP
jgi:hypothetical protein